MFTSEHPRVGSLHTTGFIDRVGTEARDESGLVRAMAFVYGFVAFCPLPAFPVGQTSAIQMGNLIGLISLGIMLMHKNLPGRHLITWLLLIAPAAASIGGTSSSMFADPILSLKGLLVWCLATSHVIVAGFFVTTSMKRLLSGISTAIILHFIVGVIQWVSFQQNEFPFLWLYQTNPVYHFDRLLATAYAVYMKRPFGLFPEPSAMAASIGPWIVFTFALLLGLLWKKQRLARKARFLYVAAMAAGVALILLSESRYLFFLVAGMGLPAAAWVFESGGSYSAPIRRLLMATVLLVALAAFVGSVISTRYAGAGAQAYTLTDGRAVSMLDGVSMLVKESTPAQLFTGFGIGQSATLMQRAKGWDAVWSVILTNVLETGFLGLVSWIVVVLLVSRAILRSESRVTGLAMFFLWLGGVGVTTSYFDLIPIWICLGCLLSWQHITASSEQQTETFR